jgi:hypothetical protein
MSLPLTPPAFSDMSNPSGVAPLTGQSVVDPNNPINKFVQEHVSPLVSPFINEFNDSPMGKAFQGKFNEVIPALKKRAADVASGKVPVMFGGEMEMTPGAGMGLGEVPTPNDLSMGNYVFDKGGNLVKNANPKPPTYAIKQEAPKSGFTPEELAQNREVPPKTTADQPVPVKPTYSKPGDLSGRQVVQQKLNGIDNYQLPQTYGGNRASFEATDKSVMQNDIGGNTFDQVLHNLNAAKQRVWNDTIQIAKNDQTPVSVNTELMPYVDKYLNTAVADGTIQADFATQAKANFYYRLLDKVKTDNPGNPDAIIDPNGANLSKEQLLYLNKAANELSSSAYNDFNAQKTGLNAQQQIDVALSRGVNDALTNALPDAKTNLIKYSSMTRIGDNITPAMRNQDLTIAKLPIINKGIPGTGLIRRVGAAAVGGDPLAMGTLGIAGAAGLYGANKLGLLKPVEDSIASTFGYFPKSNADQTQNKPQGDNSHNNSITQGVNSDGYFSVTSIPASSGDVKLDAGGHITLPSPTQIKDANGQVIGIDTNSYNQQVSKLNNDIAANRADSKSLDATIANPAQGRIQADQDQLDSLKTLHDSSAPLNTGYTFANTVSGKVSTALDMLNTTAPNISNLNGAINELRKSLDPAYAGLAQNLETIQKQFGTELNGKTRDALISELSTINKQIGYDYLTAVKTYVGGNTVPTNPMAPGPNGIPAFPTSGVQAPASTEAQDFSAITGGTPPVLQFPKQ